MWGVMATNTYGDFCPASWNVGMVLRNLSAREVHIPPKTVIGNLYKQLRKSLIGRCSATQVRTFLQRSRRNHQRSARLAVQIPSEKEVTQLTNQSPQSEMEVPTLEHDVLENVNLAGCAEWDLLRISMKAWSILREYAWTSLLRMTLNSDEPPSLNIRSPWRRRLGPLRNAIGECHQGCMMRSRSTSRKLLMSELYDHPIVPGLVQLC